MVGIVLLNQEAAWLVLVVLKWNDLSQFTWVALLSVVDCVSINDNVLSKILISRKSMIVWWGRLVNGPVVEWWVPDWVSLAGLNQVVAVDSVNNDISKLQVLISFISMVMWW